MENSQQKRIINSCNTCRVPIHEGEPIYVSSVGRNSGGYSGAYGRKNFKEGYQGGTYGGYYGGTKSSERWAQCAWCYDQWQAEISAKKKFWWNCWIWGLLIVIALTVGSIVHQLTQKEETISPWYKVKLFSLGGWKIPLTTFLILVLGICLVAIIGKNFQPQVDRYKLRKRF